MDDLRRRGPDTISLSAPIARRFPSMCEEWFQFRQRRDTEEDGRSEFERTAPSGEPEPAEERAPARDERPGAPVGAER
jgi:hypothetical protein